MKIKITNFLRSLGLTIAVIASLSGVCRSQGLINPYRFAYVYSDEYQAVLDYATTQGYEQPVEWDRIQEDIWVRSLVSSGIFATTDQLFNFASTGSQDFSLINIKAPGTRNGLLSNPGVGPQWIKGTGFFGNGSSVYIRTQYTPSTNASLFTQNDAGVFLRICNDVAGSAATVDFGANDLASVNATHCSIRNASNNLVLRLNSTTAASISNTTTSGNYAFSRTASTTTKVFKNGSQLGATSAILSTGLTAQEIYLDAYNNNGAVAGHSIKQIGFYSIGSNLDSHQSNYNTYTNTFLASTKTITSPSFANKTSISDFLTSASGLKRTFEYGQPAQQIITITGGEYFGGALASNGYIYCPPGSTTNALKINTANQTAATFGSFVAGSFKYGGAVFANGSIYFIPSSATVVAKVNISTDAVTFFDQNGVQGTESGALGATTQKFYGGYIGSDGRIYCMAFNNTAIMIIDPTDDSIEFLDTSGIVAGPTGNLTGSAKWDTGVAYGQYVYGSPSTATDMLKIDTSVPSCSRINNTFPSGAAKWVFPRVSSTGYIYFFPYFRNDIVKLDPSDDSYTYLSATIGSVDSNEKILGVSITPSGDFLLLSYAATYTNNYVLNPETDELLPFVRINTAKHNGATITADGSIYGMPSGGTTSLIRYYYPRRTISLSDNFTDSNFVKGY